MTGDLAARFDRETYTGDEPVHVFQPDDGGSDSGGVWVSERIWHRLRLIGAAYELHLLPLLDGSTDPVLLNSTQVEQLGREVRFVGELVADPLLESHIRSLMALVVKHSDHSIAVEFP